LAGQQNGGPLDEEQSKALTTSLRYFRDAAPKHTADEEDSLFPRLRQTGDAEAIALLARIESLEQEHEYASKVHDEVDQLGQRWLDQRTLSMDDASRLSALVGQLAVLYRRHIEIEDAEVFPVAAKVLSTADRISVGAEMASRRGVA
jgi:hemerythrin-like domain-containing protein